MLRFLFRLMATFALAIAVIMAVLDVTRTIAASSLVLTPLGASWVSASPGTLDALQTFLIEKAHPLVWNPVAITILDQPGFAVFGIIALILHAIGRRSERRIGRFVVER